MNALDPAYKISGSSVHLHKDVVLFLLYSEFGIFLL